MPVFIPVQGWYDAVTKSIEITFLQDTGGATISVQGMTYSTNGEAGHTECIVLPENTEGTVCISVECASGSYMGYVDVN
ncbi:MAG: hypothetical protein LBR65_06005 [Culturomica sp.]|nr:hypothetical protein [Culturomica sp.]